MSSLPGVYPLGGEGVGVEAEEGEQQDLGEEETSIEAVVI